MSISTEIVVSGGGIAGLTAACLFGSAGHDVICIEPQPPATDRDATGADLRSTAFLQPSVRVLELAGVWARLQSGATDLQVMRIVDAGGPDGTPRAVRDFDARDISDLPFGWNIPNWLIRRELLARIEELSTVTLMTGVATQAMLARTSGAKLSLSNGDTVRAQLVIAADGRGSLLRCIAGIGVKTKRYGQKALAFAVTHDAPHNNISTEIHRSGGPFTLVPLPDHDGRPSSAVVWMETGAQAQRLYDLPAPDFEAEMTVRSCTQLGALKLASDRSIWPIISQTADRFSGQRLALVAEAAHVVPPIGAQGLNMSLADLELLHELASRHHLGDEDMLDAYDKRRRLIVKARVAGVDLLNRTSMADHQIIKDLRSFGIGVLHDTKPIRTGLMRMGLGQRPL